MQNRQVNEVLALLAVKLGQPGLLSDIADAYRRLSPNPFGDNEAKENIRLALVDLQRSALVHLYAGRRYMLTPEGEDRVTMSGLRSKIDARRMYLLKETRRNNLAARSDTRNRLLEQRSQ